MNLATMSILSLLRRLTWPLVILLVTQLLGWAGFIEIFSGTWQENAARVLKTSEYLAVGWLANRLFNVLFWENFVAKALGKKPPQLLIQLSSFIVFLVVLSIILNKVYQYPVVALWTASGALGLVIGLALRNLILDTFSGLAIHIENPFEIGDFISCQTRSGSFMGEVVETNWRTTRLKAPTGNLVVIPNSMITSTVIVNFSRPDSVSEFEVDVTIDFSVPTSRVLKVIDTAILEAITKGIFLADAKVQISKFSDFGVVYTTVYNQDLSKISKGKAKHIYLSILSNHLRNSGLSISYPKQDVYNTDMPWRQKTWNHKQDATSQLHHISLFELLSQEDITILADRLKLITLMAEQDLVKIGEEGSSMFILAEGLLEVFIPDSEGNELKVADLAPGAFLGEKSLLTGAPRSATVRAKTGCLVIEVTKEAMQELMDHNESVISLMSQVLAERELANLKSLETQANKKESNLAETQHEFLNKIKRFFCIKSHA